jgi:hypothetical protein
MNIILTVLKTLNSFGDHHNLILALTYSSLVGIKITRQKSSNFTDLFSFLYSIGAFSTEGVVHGVSNGSNDVFHLLLGLRKYKAIFLKYNTFVVNAGWQK